jgi:hypothetical protein
MSGGSSKDMYLAGDLNNVLGAGNQTFNNSSFYIIDADGIVRRPMGAWVPGGTTASTTVGLPMATVWTTSMQTSASANANFVNRPIILHRPFRSVAELAYVFSDTPWRNLDFFTPESGFSALLDTFCINDCGDANSMVAGKVDLNTRQAPVLAALLAGALRDELQTSAPVILSTNAPLNPNNSSNEVAAIANALVSRTADFTNAGKGPLANIADLVGRYGTDFTNGAISPAPSQPYDGFSKDLGQLYGGTATSANNLVGRFRESAMRALSDTGQVGTWNLLIDLVAQTGKYPAGASSADKFIVEGENRCWIHLAIDRQTGKVLDMQLEPVNE